MSKRVVELFVFDIFVAILKIQHTSKKFDNAQSLLYSYTNWDSVIREFEIIGEASKYLIQENLLKNDYRSVVSFRNKIIHEYFGINSDEVWDIVNHDLEKFRKVILEIIKLIKTDLKDELVNAFIEDNKYLNFVVEQLELLKDID